MGVAERRARGKAALKQKILTAAVEIMATEGYEGLSIRRLADKIEYAPSTIYLYFRDKFDIVATICVETFTRLTEEVTRITAQCTDPVQGLRQGCRCYVDFGIAHPSHYQVSFCQPPPKLPPGQPNPCLEAAMKCFGTLQRAVWECVQAGRVLPLDINLLSESIWVSLHGLTSLMITHGEDPDFPWVDRETLIETTLNSVLRGVLVNPSELPISYQATVQ
jgi:AcrR family transcriptional regulator